MNKPKILIATGNAGKAREIRRILEPKFSDIDWINLKDLNPIEEPEETGQTFQENAELKARYYAKETGLMAMADDSGLEVKALDMGPGVYSARFSGPDATDQKNNEKLIASLQEVPPEKREAQYRAVVALAKPTGDTICAEGESKGQIIDTPRGENGFGYDPHFFIPELQKTFAEITSQEKDARSHRARALEALIPEMKRFLR